MTTEQPKTSSRPGPQRPDPEAEPRSDAATAARATRRTVLVATGEPHLGDAVEALLRHHAVELAPGGLEVARAASGAGCLQQVELLRPDLVIAHARLDDMSAVELAASFAEAHGGERLPCLVLSALAGRDLPPGWPAESVLSVPFHGADLIERVAHAFAAPT